MRLSKRGTVNWATAPRHKPPTAALAPMTNAEFRQLCDDLAIKDAQTASDLLGPHWRTCQRYYYGELTIPPPLARLLRLAVTHHSSHAELRSLATVDTRLRSLS